MVIKLLHYDKAEELIEEGYVLLFRGTTLISKFIGAFGTSPYSHVGIASWSNGGSDPILELLEYKEFKGSRATSLRNNVIAHNGHIDVFAPCTRTEQSYYDVEEGIVKTKIYSFNGRAITKDFRRYTGLAYSYQRILFMLWFHIPFLRLFTGNNVFNDESNDTPSLPVCSTSVAHFFSKHYVDLVKFKSDEFVEPGDLARSPVLSYLFTLVI